MKTGHAILIGAGAVVFSVVGIHLYGRTQHRAGYEDAQQDAQAQVQRIEQGMQHEKEQADARFRGAVLAREVAERDLAAVRSSLDGLLRAHGSDPANSTTGPRIDGADPDWIGGFAACYAQYGELASDAAVWADRVNGLQDYVRSVVTSSP